MIDKGDKYYCTLRYLFTYLVNEEGEDWKRALRKSMRYINENSQDYQ